VLELYVITFILFFFVYKYFFYNKKKYIPSQLDNHILIKKYLKNQTVKEQKKTQMNSRQKDAVKVLVFDETAYWVQDNIFYYTNVIDNIPNMVNAQPVNISEMSKQELDKMLFILDNIVKEDDR